MKKETTLISIRGLFELYNLGKERIERSLYKPEPLMDELLDFQFEITPDDLLDYTELCLTGEADE